jgi:hypothetical protein
LISNPPSDAQKRAQAKFDKYEVKKREGDAALAAYHAENRAIEAKTARLKAARLAKEAADREAAANAPPPPVKAVRAKKKKVAVD